MIAHHPYVVLPSWRYIPGAGGEPDRPPLDAAKATIAGPPQPHDWTEHAAYRYGALLHVNGFFWEAHEVWEAVWLVCPPNSAARHLLRGLIQTANAALKIVMERPQAARRLLAEAHDLLAEAERAAAVGPFLGVDLRETRAAVATLAAEIATEIPPGSVTIIQRPIFPAATRQAGDMYYSA